MPQRDEVTAFVALGANLGDPAQALREALRCMSETPGLRLVRASSLYRTAPIDSSGPDYLNAVAEIATTLTAPDLLTTLQAIEQGAGRERPYRNAPIHSATLIVPHPRMGERAFVLVPLSEIAPERVTDEALAAVSGQGIQCM